MNLATEKSSARVKQAAEEVIAVLDKYEVVLAIDLETFGYPYVYIMNKEDAEGESVH